MDSISAASSRPTRSFSSGERVTLPGRFLSVKLISFIARCSRSPTNAFRRLDSRVQCRRPRSPILIFDCPINAADGKTLHSVSTKLNRLLPNSAGEPKLATRMALQATNVHIASADRARYGPPSIARRLVHHERGSRVSSLCIVCCRRRNVQLW